MEGLCSQEVSVLLRNKGFEDDSYTKEYHSIGLISREDGKWHSDIGVPAYSRWAVEKWLRDKNIFLFVEPFLIISCNGHELHGYRAMITSFQVEKWQFIYKGEETIFTTYEEAEDEAIKQCLNLWVK